MLYCKGTCDRVQIKAFNLFVCFQNYAGAIQQNSQILTKCQSMAHGNIGHVFRMFIFNIYENFEGGV